MGYLDNSKWNRSIAVQLLLETFPQLGRWTLSDAQSNWREFLKDAIKHPPCESYKTRISHGLTTLVLYPELGKMISITVDTENGNFIRLDYNGFYRDLVRIETEHRIRHALKSYFQPDPEVHVLRTQYGVYIGLTDKVYSLSGSIFDLESIIDRVKKDYEVVIGVREKTGRAGFEPATVGLEVRCSIQLS